MSAETVELAATGGRRLRYRRHEDGVWEVAVRRPPSRRELEDEAEVCFGTRARWPELSRKRRVPRWFTASDLTLGYALARACGRPWDDAGARRDSEYLRDRYGT